MVLDAQRLPPTGRDFEVYELVQVNGLSTRQAAGMMKISQTRVCQIAAKVAQFMTQTLPGVEAATPEAKAKSICVAQHVAGARIDHLYKEALRSFVESRGTETVSRAMQIESRSSGTVVTIRQSQGDCRYLSAAARLAILGSKLPASLITYGWFAQAEDEIESAAELETSPPVVDCSLPAANSAHGADRNPTRQHVSLFAVEDCDREATDSALLANRTLPTVHPDESPLEELTRPTVEDDARPLSRQERRARKRLLERRMKKAK